MPCAACTRLDICSCGQDSSGTWQHAQFHIACNIRSRHQYYGMMHQLCLWHVTESIHFAVQCICTLFGMLQHTTVVVDTTQTRNCHSNKTQSLPACKWQNKPGSIKGIFFVMLAQSHHHTHNHSTHLVLLVIFLVTAAMLCPAPAGPAHRCLTPSLCQGRLPQQQYTACHAQQYCEGK